MGNIAATNSDADDQAKKNKATNTLFKDFSEETSLHGVRHVMQSTTPKWRRIPWLLLVLAAMATVTIILYEKSKSFQRKPIVINVDIKTVTELKLPVVAFCNINQYRYSYVTKNTYKALGEKFNQQKKVNFSAYQTEFDKLGNMTSLEYLLEASHQMNDMFLSCRLPDGTDCLDRFEPVATDYGICYAINAGINDSIMARKAGASNGLQVLMNVEDYDHGIYSEAANGVKVVIYNKGDVPMVRQKAIEIAPGYSSQISIKKFQQEKIDKSGGGTCVNGMNLKYYRSWTYSASVCHMDNLVSTVDTKCSCAPFYTPNATIASLGLTMCSPMEHFACVVDVESSNTSDCWENCYTEGHRVRFSFSELPGTVMERSLNWTKVDIRFKEGMEAKSRFFSKEALNLKVKIGFLKGANEELRKLRLLPDGSYDGYLPISRRLFGNCTCYHKIWEKYGDIFAYDLFSNRYSPPLWRLAEVIYGSKYFAICSAEDRNKFLHKNRGEMSKYANAARQIVHPLKYLADLFAWRGFEKELTKPFPSHNNTFESINRYQNGTYTKRMLAMDFPHKYDTRQFQLQFANAIHRNLERVIDAILMQRHYRLSNLPLWDELNRDTIYAVAELILLGSDVDCTTASNVPVTGDECATNRTSWFTVCEYNFIGNVSAHKRPTISLEAFAKQADDCAENDILQRAVNIRNKVNKATSSFMTWYEQLGLHLEAYYERLQWENHDSFYRNNIAGVNLYYSDMIIDTVKQERSYDEWSLLCDIGGTMGLFLGASLLTIFEIIDFLIFKVLLKYD